MSPRLSASLLRFARIVIANALVAALAAGWSWFTSNGTELGITNGTLLAVVAVGGPIVAAIDKFVRSAWMNEA